MPVLSPSTGVAVPVPESSADGSGHVSSIQPEEPRAITRVPSADAATSCGSLACSSASFVASSTTSAGSGPERSKPSSIQVSPMR